MRHCKVSISIEPPRSCGRGSPETSLGRAANSPDIHLLSTKYSPLRKLVRLDRIFGAAPSALIRTPQNPGLTAGATMVPALRAWCRGYRLRDCRPRNINCRPRIPRIAASKTRYQGSPGREAGVGRGQWIIQIGAPKVRHCKVSVLNELRRSRGRGSPETSPRPLPHP